MAITVTCNIDNAWVFNWIARVTGNLFLPMKATFLVSQAAVMVQQEAVVYIR